MGAIAKGNTVVVMRCEEYDRARIQEIVSQGMRRLKYHPTGKVFGASPAV